MVAKSAILISLAVTAVLAGAGVGVAVWYYKKERIDLSGATVAITNVFGGVDNVVPSKAYTVDPKKYFVCERAGSGYKLKSELSKDYLVSDTSGALSMAATGDIWEIEKIGSREQNVIYVIKAKNGKYLQLASNATAQATKDKNLSWWEYFFIQKKKV